MAVRNSIFMLLTWELPFAGRNINDIKDSIRKFKIENELKEIPDEYEVFKGIIPGMLKSDKNRRMTLNNVEQ